jgi:hypothetical protein
MDTRRALDDRDGLGGRRPALARRRHRRQRGGGGNIGQMDLVLALYTLPRRQTLRVNTSASQRVDDPRGAERALFNTVPFTPFGT